METSCTRFHSRLLKKAHLRRWFASALAAPYLQYVWTHLRWVPRPVARRPAKSRDIWTLLNSLGERRFLSIVVGGDTRLSTILAVARTRGRGDIRQTNAGVLAKNLRALGVRYAFGIPSGQILAAIEAFEARGVRFVLVSHEMTAAFMADVVGRLTGVPGAALAHVRRSRGPLVIEAIVDGSRYAELLYE